VDASVASLRAVGIDAEGEVGDTDPVQAIEDALRTFQPDELVISTHPEGRSKWLERGVVERARERFALPLTHVVVDLDADSY
jgi:GABA permease